MLCTVIATAMVLVFVKCFPMSNPVRKLLLVLLFLLALICLAGVVYARFWLDPMLKDKLVTSTSAASNGMYALQIDHLHVNIFTGSVALDGVQLRTDTVLWEARHQASPDSSPIKIKLWIKRLRINDISWIRFWRTKDLDLDGIQIVEPQLDVVIVKDTAQADSHKIDTLNQGILDRLPQLIAPFANRLHIDYLAVSNGKLSLHHLRNNQSSIHRVDSINGVLSKINLTPKDSTIHDKALYCDNILFTLHNYEWYPAGNVYGYHIRTVRIDEKDALVALEGVDILPKISDGEFGQRLRLREPRVKISIKEILINKFDLFRALHKQEFTMQSVVLENAWINLFQNKNLPLSRHKRMPHELFRTINSYLNIDTILVRNSNILYTELLGNQDGQLEFENVNGVILNISNDSLKMSDATPARIDARAELMGAGLLDLSLQIPLLTPTFRCDYSAHLGAIDMTYLNRLLEDKNKIRVETGQAEKIILKVQVRNGLAQGKLEATYNNLAISLLDKKDGSKKWLTSAIANMVIRGKNKRGSVDNPFKVGTIYYRRERTDGLLRFIWRSAQMGLMATLVPRNISGGKMPD